MIRLLLSIISGFLMSLTFPKFNFGIIAWVALVPFFLAIAGTKNRKQVMACAFWFGLAYFGLHLYWVTSLFEFVQWWSVLGWASLVLYQTLFIVIFALVLRTVTSGEETFFPILTAVIWTAVEWLRAGTRLGHTGNCGRFRINRAAGPKGIVPACVWEEKKGYLLLSVNR